MARQVVMYIVFLYLDINIYRYHMNIGLPCLDDQVSERCVGQFAAYETGTRV